MDTEIDWQRELEASFDNGEDVPPEHYVLVGRGAVRRRRIAARRGTRRGKGRRETE